MAVPALSRAEHEVAALLNHYPGHAFCESCLSQKTHLEPASVHAATVALTDSQKFHRERWLCSFCRELQDVIHVPWVDTPLLAIAENPAAPDGPRRPVQPRS